MLTVAMGPSFRGRLGACDRPIVSTTRSTRVRPILFGLSFDGGRTACARDEKPAAAAAPARPRARAGALTAHVVQRVLARGIMHVRTLTSDLDVVANGHARPARVLEPPASGAREIARPAPSAEPVAGPFRKGQWVADGYEILGVLGVGGMNVVYEAYDRALFRRVAIKVPLFPAYEAALAREAQALAAIRSSAFPSVYHVTRHDDVQLVVMERLYGDTLESRLDELRTSRRTMPLGEAVQTLIAIADALSAAHRAGVAHRDLKPANVMLVGERVVLVDLGLFVPEVLVSPDNEVAGSAQYIAPEVLLRDVAKGEGPYVDLYALGVLAYELLTGVTPFMADSTERVLANHVCAPIPDVRALRDDVPVELAVLVTELLAKSPTDRPPSAESVLWQLRALDARRIHPRRALKVVAIDDEPHVRSALKRSLEDAFPRIRVEATDDPTKATRTDDGSVPDIVLVDLNMPRENGIEVCMDLLALPESERPTVVAMSSQAEPRDLAVLEALGVRHFVSKGDDFLAKMSALVGRLRADGALG
jgi:serine/threonine-protein kinase